MGENTKQVRVIFFDVRDTLGEVDLPGHLVPYRPSTESLLEATSCMGVKLGVITNLPDNVTDEQGRKMVAEAVLSQDEKTGAFKTVGSFIPRENIITNHQASAALGTKVNKPFKEIYQFAAEKLGVEPSECLFIGENLNEVVGAEIAGMRARRKECPPGRDFAPALVGRIGASAVDSGRQFQALLEHEHLLGERIFACGEKIGAELQKLTEGKAPPLDKGRWISPDPVSLSDGLRRAMAYFVHLIDHFADQVHLRAEEAMIEVAIACGMNAKHGEWVINQHEQARAYWSSLNVAWKRIEDGDPDDRWYALIDFERSIEAFVYLFKAHAVRENFQLYTEAGNFFNDSDDSLVLNIIEHSGPSDITPYIGMVERMEGLLGISASK
jgi:hemerythrin-like domain-containing protein